MSRWPTLIFLSCAYLLSPKVRAFDYQNSVRTCVFYWTNKLTDACKTSLQAKGETQAQIYLDCTTASTSASDSIVQTCEDQANKAQKAAEAQAASTINSNSQHNTSCPMGAVGGCQQNVPLPPTKPSNTPMTAKSVTPTKTKVSSADTAAKPKPSSMNNDSPTQPSTSSADAEAEASADLAQCSNLESQASRCCGNPLSCSDQLSAQDQQSLADLESAMNSGAGSNSGMNGDCQQMAQLGSNSGHLNNSLASICAGDQSGCANTCGQLVQKYQQKLSACQGCTAESVYQNTLNTLSSYQNNCQQLQGRASQLAQQGISSGVSTGSGDACNQLASAMPQSTSSQPVAMAAVNANDPYGCQANPNQPACQSCAENPSLPGCDQAAPNTGQAGFAQGSAEPKPSDFNVGDPNAGVQPQAQIPVIQARAAQRVPSVRNNTGGGIPGDSDDSGHINVNQARGPKVVGSGYSTDVLKGYRWSGGYSRSYSSTGEASSYYNPAWGPKIKKKPSFRSFSLMSYLKNWMSGGIKPLKKIAVALGLSNPRPKQSSSRPELLGQGGETYLDSLPPSPNRKTHWFLNSVVALTLLGLGLIFWKLWLHRRDLKEKLNAFDRRQAERRLSRHDRRSQSTPIEPHMERRRPEGKDRRIRDQRIAERRQSEISSRRVREETVIARLSEQERRSTARGRRAVDVKEEYKDPGTGKKKILNH